MNPADEITKAFHALLQRAIAEAPQALPEMFEALAAATAPVAAPVAAADEPWHGLIGSCPAMLAMRERIVKFAPASAAVLVTGESGTGKERVAHALHALSRRAKGPFVAENCAAIPDSLLESVLFGHKKGSSTLR